MRKVFKKCPPIQNSCFLTVNGRKEAHGFFFFSKVLLLPRGQENLNGKEKLLLFTNHLNCVVKSSTCNKVLWYECS